ncbi:MAG TPA: hypothetical protein VGB42_03740 [Candidatus Thermoplasmatota archaeon]
MAHKLQLFSGGCPLCVSFLREIEAGKCGPCELEVLDTRDPASRHAMAEYDVRVVPTLVVDGRIRIEGALDVPWVCDDDFYARLERMYPIPNARLM